MKITIEPITDQTVPGKAKVLYQGWQDTYHGIISDQYLSSLDYETCLKKSYDQKENTFVALVGQKVVGFISICRSRDNDRIGSGEIKAIYILKEYQHQGIGKKLMEYGLHRLQGYPSILLWAAKENKNAISFYESIGFTYRGDKKTYLLGGAVDIIRMEK